MGSCVCGHYRTYWNQLAHGHPIFQAALGGLVFLVRVYLVDVRFCWRCCLEREIVKATTKYPKRKTEYKEGREAQKDFEKTMKTLFQAPKSVSKKSPKGKDWAAFRWPRP